jgi:hypothetical protein
VLSLQGAFEFRVGGQERVEETHELRPARALFGGRERKGEAKRAREKEGRVERVDRGREVKKEEGG